MSLVDRKTIGLVLGTYSPNSLCCCDAIPQAFNDLMFRFWLGVISLDG